MNLARCIGSALLTRGIWSLRAPLGDREAAQTAYLAQHTIRRTSKWGKTRFDAQGTFARTSNRCPLTQSHRPAAEHGQRGFDGDESVTDLISLYELYYTESQVALNQACCSVLRNQLVRFGFAPMTRRQEAPASLLAEQPQACGPRRWVRRSSASHPASWSASARIGRRSKPRSNQLPSPYLKTEHFGRARRSSFSPASVTFV
jgi:hypothetical protein